MVGVTRCGTEALAEGAGGAGSWAAAGRAVGASSASTRASAKDLRRNEERIGIPLSPITKDDDFSMNRRQSFLTDCVNPKSSTSYTQFGRPRFLFLYRQDRARDRMFSFPGSGIV